MGTRERMIATIVIWIAAAGIIISTVSQATVAANLDVNGLTGIVMGAAALATIGMWRGGGDSKALEKLLKEQEKAKHNLSPRVERLMDDLDEEETAQLADLLRARGQDQWRQD